MKWRILISAIVAGLLAVLVVVFSTGFRSPIRATDISVGFLGFTNLPGQGTYALLGFTNPTVKTVAVGVDSFEELVAGDWINRRLTTNTGGNKIRFMNGGGRWMTGFVGWQAVFQPGDSHVACIPAPSFSLWRDQEDNLTPDIPAPVWRARFYCQERVPGDWFHDLSGTATSDSFILIRPGSSIFHNQVFSGRRYTVISPEVAP